MARWGIDIQLVIWLLHDLCVPFNKLYFTSKKSTICNFFFISILKPAFLKISIMSFYIQSAFCLDVFLKSSSSLSQYKSVDCLSSLFDNRDSIWMPRSSQISAPSNCPWWRRSSFLYFFAQGSLWLYNMNFHQCFIICKSFFWNINIFLGKHDSII